MTVLVQTENHGGVYNGFKTFPQCFQRFVKGPGSIVERLRIGSRTAPSSLDINKVHEQHINASRPHYARHCVVKNENILRRTQPLNYVLQTKGVMLTQPFFEMKRGFHKRGVWRKTPFFCATPRTLYPHVARNVSRVRTFHCLGLGELWPIFNKDFSAVARKDGFARLRELRIDNCSKHSCLRVKN